MIYNRKRKEQKFKNKLYALNDNNHDNLHSHRLTVLQRYLDIQDMTLEDRREVTELSELTAYNRHSMQNYIIYISDLTKETTVQTSGLKFKRSYVYLNLSLNSLKALLTNSRVRA